MPLLSSRDIPEALDVAETRNVNVRLETADGGEFYPFDDRENKDPIKVIDAQIIAWLGEQIQVKQKDSFKEAISEIAEEFDTSFQLAVEALSYHSIQAPNFVWSTVPNFKFEGEMISAIRWEFDRAEFDAGDIKYIISMFVYARDILRAIRYSSFSDNLTSSAKKQIEKLQALARLTK